MKVALKALDWGPGGSTGFELVICPKLGRLERRTKGDHVLRQHVFHLGGHFRKPNGHRHRLVFSDETIALYNHHTEGLGMSGQPIRILSVDDHPVFREGLSTIIASQPDMILVSQATDAVEALSEFRRHRPDVTLMDLRLVGTNGTDALVAIRGEFPQARIVMLTTSDCDGEIQRAMRAGASAYILKSMPKNELLEVIRTVHAGRRYLPPEVAARLTEHFGEDNLTDRELQVLRLIRDGHRNKQIADQLAIAETTVNFHIKNLVDKLQANDRTHAVTIAVRRGLLEI
jgi:DNA-binding NarL/FixJ family response regulator